MGRPLNDISGEVFGALTVISLKDRSNKKGAIWELECKCGERCYSTSSDLKRGRVNICKNCNNIKSINSPFKSLYSTYKRGAKKRNLDFKITFEEFKELITKECYYCDTPPQSTFLKKGAKYSLKYNGIDRVDNKRGYVEGNLVTCCKYCNFSKSKSSFEEFKDWLESIGRKYSRKI